MPFFENTSGTVTIKDSPMTDVKGDMHHYDHSTRTTNNDSYNTTTHNLTNSNNDSYKVERKNNNVYNTDTDGRFVSGLSYFNARGEDRGPQIPQEKQGDYAPMGGMRRDWEDEQSYQHWARTGMPYPMYTKTGYGPQGDYDMGNNPQQGYTSPPPGNPSHGPSSNNPFYPRAQQPPPFPSPNAAPVEHPPMGMPRFSSP